MTTHTNSPSLGVESTQTEGSPMTPRTYQPTGTGLCADCGHDVGRHDGGHKFRTDDLPIFTTGPDLCLVDGCRRPLTDPIHDVGRVLRCPEEED